MVSLFITAFVLVLGILLLSAIGLYFWQKTARDNSERVLPPNPGFYRLFGNQPNQTELKTQAEIERLKAREASLIDRARAGDKSALINAKETRDGDLYDRLLNEHVQRVDSEATLL